MSGPVSYLQSSVGKKILNGLTGLALIGFVVGHLAGNLTLFVGGDAFNAYTQSLQSLGGLLVVVEIGLTALFALHAISAIAVWRDKKKARHTHNTRMATKGSPSKQSLASRTMIVTGTVLLVFLVVHIWQFRFGPVYLTKLDGVEVRDLYRLVVETFQSPFWTAAYMAVMILLGFHLRHGTWSAFQSLGLLDARIRPFAYSAAAAVAVAIGFGFFILPLYLFMTVNP